jgi:hypothetical protein
LAENKIGELFDKVKEQIDKFITPQGKQKTKKSWQ